MSALELLNELKGQISMSITQFKLDNFQIEYWALRQVAAHGDVQLQGQKSGC